MRVLAGELGYKRLAVFNISYDHPLCRTLRGLDCRVEMQHTRNGSAMGAIVNLRGCLEAMAQELSARLASSRMAGFRGRLAIKSELETVTLELEKGAVAVLPKAGACPNAISGGKAVARLLIGSEEPATLALQGMKFAGAAMELAEAIFPRQWPMLNQLDHF